jgi:serine/threonine-protein kinase
LVSVGRRVTVIGSTLAHYRIAEKIGAGGMGEVYRATDTKLARDVALKMLPPHFARDPDRLARFRREALVLASLNHPNIAAIYGLESDGDSHALVLELVEGPTLADRLRTGRLPAPESLDVARQIAEAVEYAHENGVIHRDLKPGNVKLSRDDRVKVLDFGLAKALTEPHADSDAGPGGPDSPTVSPALSTPVTGALTGPNVILGTAAYMSPEQARGRPADRRSDVWSFGVLLFEMLSGRRPFAGETPGDTLASVLRTEPDWSLLPADVPPRLRELTERCLAKDARRRLRDMGDVRLELEWIRDGEARPEPARDGMPAGRRRGLPFVIAAVVAGVVAGALLGSLLPVPRSDGGDTVRRLNLVLPADLAVYRYRLSPDGRTFAFWAQPRDSIDANEAGDLYLRPVGDYAVLPALRDVGAACFSPDGRWLAAVARPDPESTKRSLWKLPVDGTAPPLELLDWDPRWNGLQWLPDGDLLTGVVGGAIVRVPTDGSPARDPLPLVPDEPDVEPELFPVGSWGTLLPDGRHLLADVETWGERGYRTDVFAVDLQTGRMKRVLENGRYARWSATGHLLFSRGTSLLAAPFDPDALELTGGPTALVDDLRIDTSWGHGSFEIAADGTLVYTSGGFVGGSRRLVWLDPDFREIGPWSEEGVALEHGPFVSPDGRRFAAVKPGPDGIYDIWMSEPGRPVLRRWLEEPGRDCVPAAWLPDGSGLAYQSATASNSFHYLRRINEDESVLLLEDRDPTDFHRISGFADGGATLILTGYRGGETRVAMLRVPDARSGAAGPEVLLEESARGEVSPDGRWMTYVSDASGRWEVYLRRWLGDGGLGPERRVSTEGSSGAAGLWSAGRTWWYTPANGGPLELWYLGADLVVRSVALGEEAHLSGPRIVADWRPEYVYMEPVPDGRLLMLLRGENEGPPRELHVVSDWSRGLR